MEQVTLRISPFSRLVNECCNSVSKEISNLGSVLVMFSLSFFILSPGAWDLLQLLPCKL